MMQAYHSNTELKTAFVAEIEKHRQMDQIVQRHGYWKQDRGCAVGCSLHSLAIVTGKKRLPSYSNHAAYETLIGVPQILARLEDGIFENLPAERAQTWPGEFAAAIPVGADLSLVWPKFAVWLLADTEHGVIRYARTDKAHTAIQTIADLYQQMIGGAIIDVATWRDARSGAYADAAYAAYAAAADAAAAAYAAAAYAAYAYAAAYATYATYAAAAAARQQARVVQADKLIELLQAA